MQRILLAALALVLILIINGCAAMPSHYSWSLEEKDMSQGLEDGQVLIIAKVIVDPVPKQSNTFSPFGKVEGVVFLYMTNTLEQKVKMVDGDLQKDIPTLEKTDEALGIDYNKISYTPAQPTSKYIRYSSVYLGTKCVATEVNVSSPGEGGCRSAITYQIWLTKNIRVTVPEKAKAVYIGTIYYKHANNHLVSVQVIDEYNEAMADLAKKNVAGIKPRNVVKSLARVL